jgi:hypothetical protein
MKTFARVIEICPIISGTSDNGNDWEKQTIVLETLGLEPMTLAVEFMGERKTKQTKLLKMGQQVEVDFVIRCNKYLDKWYTRLDGLKAKPMEEEAEAAEV